MDLLSDTIILSLSIGSTTDFGMISPTNLYSYTYSKSINMIDPRFEDFGDNLIISDDDDFVVLKKIDLSIVV